MASPPRTSADIERRALALVERLSDWQGDPGHMARLRARLLRREPPDVIARVAALEAAIGHAAQALPTAFAGMAAPLPPPERIGAFRLTRKLGEGGMGEVWLSRRDDGLYEQLVAIKLIRVALSARALDAFAAERRILAQLEHPNIARLIDGGVAPDGRPYLVMEYFEGQPIDAAAAAMPVDAKVKLLLKAADAVQFAHSRLVVHADIKPSNLLVDAQGRVKLLDFGIARLLDREGETSRAAAPMTPGFASPERQSGAPPSVSDDVFALGVVLRLVLGAGVDADLQAIVAKASAQEARYASVGALIADLERWRDRLPVSAQRDTLFYRARKFVQRHRAGAVVTLAAFLAVSAAGLVAQRNYLVAARERAEAQHRFDDARGIARYLLFEHMDRLERLPNSLKDRAEVANVAQHYLDRLSSAERAGPDVRLEAATGLWRLAQHQGGFNRPNLHLPAAAETNLQRAELIAADLTGAPARLLLANVRIERALIAASLDGDAGRAREILDSAKPLIAATAQRDPAIRSRWLLADAAVSIWRGDYARALAATADGLRLPPPGAPRAAALQEAALLDMRAEAAFYSRKLDMAEGLYRRQMAVLEAAHRRWQDIFVLDRLARARWNLGTTLMERQNFAAALPLLTAAKAESQRVRAFDPDDQAAARMYGIVETAQAQCLGYMGRFAEAEPIFRGRVAQAQAALQRAPGDPSRLHDYAMAQVMFGEALANARRLREGCAVDTESLTAFMRLKTMGRLSQLDLDHNIALLETRMAKNCPDMKQG